MTVPPQKSTPDDNTPAATSGSAEKSPSPSSLVVTINEVAPGVVVVGLQGKADTLTVERMQLALMRLIARRVPLAVLNASQLLFLSSLAIGALVSFRRDLKRFGGCVRIAGMRPEVYEVLDVMRLTEMFEFCSTVEEATAAT